MILTNSRRLKRAGDYADLLLNKRENVWIWRLRGHSTPITMAFQIGL
jgi:hypothetical protein